MLLKKKETKMARTFTNIDTAEAAYENLKERLERGKANRSEAVSLLNQIINDLPGTWIANLARQLRDEI